MTMRSTLGAAFGILITVGCLLVLVGSAAASSELVPGEHRPLEITKFDLETTHTIERVEDFHGVGKPVRIFENVPYTFTQAGGHPWALTAKVQFATETVHTNTDEPVSVPTSDPKDVVVDLPPGLLGDPMAMPRCPLTLLLGGGNTGEFRCPTDTQLGVARVKILGGKEFVGPIVNVTPELGQSAEFGLETSAKVTFLETGRLVYDGSAKEYGFAVTSNNIPLDEVAEVEQTFWGVPADPSHDAMRGMFCEQAAPGAALCEVEPPGAAHGGGLQAGISPAPFLTWMTDCSAGPEQATIRGDSWEEPEREVVDTPPVTLAGATGCNLLKFEPTIEVQPDRVMADEPVGLGVDLKIPLNESPEANATPQLRNLSVTLPEGMSVSPGVVDGIVACQKEGPEGIDIGAEKLGPNGELQLAPGHCPDASTVGTAEAITPFLPVPVKGHVYLAKPECGGVGEAPCTEQDVLDGKLYKLYLELGGTGEDADTGIEFKVEGDVQVNPATGQLTTVFENLVQAPYSEVRTDLNGGPRASLANPAVCGPAVTTSDFSPWSAPGETKEGLLVAGTPDATPFSEPFVVEGCSDPTPFKPGFTAGTVTPQAGQFSSFTMNLTRQDREQYVKGIQLHTPPGLLGLLSSVPLCGEPQADVGTCPESSKIGTTVVATGAGSHPFEIGGNVYLTGPYDGAPFGLSIVVHVVAGPFNLGVKVVRAQIAVNPENSTLTVTTDETGPYAVPQIVFGVPVRLKRVTVDIDRPDFMFNPTNCDAQQIIANVSGSEDGVSSVSSPFAVGGCKSLEFKPSFVATTSAHTSRSDGASLEVKLTYPAGSMGSAADVARAKVSLPKQLPSRLTTLQKACTAKVFDANPAGCPAASIVGIARTKTPLLPVELAGPVYFVSHGGEAFPNLIIVLQGDGVRVDLVADTFISKAGVTTSTLNAVPDVPVESFELFLPEGKYSALAANGDLCTADGITKSIKRTVAKTVDGRRVKHLVTKRVAMRGLAMPTEFVGQNGAVVKQETKVEVTGCGGGKARSSRATASRRGSDARERAAQ
jgi:hypothetical protein